MKKLTADSTTLTLVNLDPVAERELIVQAGAYAEHRFERVESPALAAPVALAEGQGDAIRVRLAPSSLSELTLSTRRYVGTPTALEPWER